MAYSDVNLLPLIRNTESLVQNFSVQAAFTVPVRPRHVPALFVARVCLYTPVGKGILCGSAIKHQVATIIAQRLPEPAPFVPPRRKPWMPEHHNSPIFDAPASGLTFLHRENNPLGGLRVSPRKGAHSR